MRKKNSQDKLYLKTLHELRKLIAKEYKDGGRLPSHRVMSERLGVSIMTYTKAVKCLIEDNTIARIAVRSGTFIAPEFARCRKIGIVIRTGGESPFIGSLSLFNGLTEVFDQNGFQIHILQSPVIENIQDKAVQNGVKAIVWLNPQERLIPVMKKIQQDGEFPLIVPGTLSREMVESCIKENINIVTIDHDRVGELVTKTLKKRHHKSVVYVGNFQTIEFLGGVKAFKKAGIQFSPEQCVLARDIDNQLLNVIEASSATCVFAGGGAIVYRKIVDKILTLPEDKQPELLVRGADRTSWKQEGQKVKIIGTSHEDTHAIGKYAAEMLVRHLNNGEPLKPVFLPVSKICKLIILPENNRQP